MEYIEGVPLKEQNSLKYYKTLKKALVGGYVLDKKGVFHRQLGRYYHIFDTAKGVKFIDFERGIFTDKPRNFLQIVGYYLYRDDKFEKKRLDEIINIYNINSFLALKKTIFLINESIGRC